MLVISVMSQTAFLSCSDNSHAIIDCRRSCSDSYCAVRRDVRSGAGSRSGNLLEDVSVNVLFWQRENLSVNVLFLQQENLSGNELFWQQEYLSVNEMF